MIGLVVAAIFALIEYADYRRDTRVDKTVTIYENTYLKSLQPSRITLESLMNSPNTIKQLEALLFMKGDPNEIQLKWQQMVIGILDTEQLDSAFVHYVEFFDVLQSCIDSQLCDKDTAEVLFGTNPRDKKIIQFYCSYVGYLRAIWNSPSFGEKAINFTGSSCKPSSAFIF